MERLIIKNFAGISDAVVPINGRLTFIIGPQASGKSVISKLISFFKEILCNMELLDMPLTEINATKYCSLVVNKFQDFFPLRFLSESFEVLYEQNGHQFRMHRQNGGDVAFQYTKDFADILEEFFNYVNNELNKHAEQSDFNKMVQLQQKLQIWPDLLKEYNLDVSSQYFVVAERSSVTKPNHFEDRFMSAYANIYVGLKKLLAKTDKIDEFFEQFVRENILKGVFREKDGVEYMRQMDGRLVSFDYASSGQKEALPLVMNLLHLLYSVPSQKWPTTLYLEEPESHLFPSAQKAMVEAIAYVANKLDGKLQVIITTHSPYILSSCNNLIQASECVRQGADEAKVDAVVKKDFHLNYEDVTALALGHRQLTDLKDEELRLISTTSLDEISNTINAEFDQLLDLV